MNETLLLQVVCCRLTPVQTKIYKHLMSSKEIRHILNGKQTNILSSIGAMQKVGSRGIFVSTDDPLPPLSFALVLHAAAAAAAVLSLIFLFFYAVDIDVGDKSLLALVLVLVFFIPAHTPVHAFPLSCPIGRSQRRTPSGRMPLVVSCCYLSVGFASIARSSPTLCSPLCGRSPPFFSCEKKKLCNHPKLLVDGCASGKDRDSGQAAAISSMLPSATSSSSSSSLSLSTGGGGVGGGGGRRMSAGGGGFGRRGASGGTQKGVFPEWSG